MLSIIIVNYKTPQLVLDCLRSFLNDERGSGYQVIVVDNASGDNSKEIITSVFPQVEWIAMTYNAGFARANNAAIRIAKHEFILLLNSDTIVIDAALSKCLVEFKQSNYVACGVQLLNADLSPQISGNYFMTGTLNFLLSIPYLKNLLRLLGQLAGVKKPNLPDSDRPVEVDWINGAFLMVRKNAINEAGLMDEDFFLYAEEAEWCYRLRGLGKLCIFGQYKVIHLQGASSVSQVKASGEGYSNVYDKKGFQFLLSNFVRIRKQNGVLWLLFHLLAYTLSLPIVVLTSAIIKLFKPHHHPGIYSAIGFALNVLKIYTFLPKLISNRKTFYKVL